MLKSEEFFLTKTVAEVVWREIVNESVFTARNIYALYHMDIDSEGLYQKVTNGKYMWNPNEEEFPLFLRSIYHVARDLLDAVEAECKVTENTEALRISCQERLFHCLAMQFVEPADCLPKVAEPNKVDNENRNDHLGHGESEKPEAIDLKSFYACSSYGRPRSKCYYWPYYKKLLKENDLPDIRWHDLISTFCTLLLKNDFNPKAVSKLMGHAKKIITMDVYGDNQNIIADCVGEMQSFVDEVMPGEGEQENKEQQECDEIVIDIEEYLSA